MRSYRRFRASWRHPSPEPLPTPSRTATRSLFVTVTSGHVPLRGVIEVTSTPSGKELIRYRKAVKDAASPGKWLLSRTDQRGTKGHHGGVRRVRCRRLPEKPGLRTKALCRPNVSAWIVIDKTLQAVQGCHVTDASISVTKEGAVELTGTLTGCRVFNAGRFLCGG